MGNHNKATNNAAPAYFRLRFWAAPFLVFLGRSDAGGSSSSSTRLRFALPAGLAGAVFAGAGAAPDGPAALTSQPIFWHCLTVAYSASRFASGVAGADVPAPPKAGRSAQARRTERRGSSGRPGGAPRPACPGPGLARVGSCRAGISAWR